MNYNDLNGVINIFKEPNYTSHDIVSILRKLLKTKKVGHAGTLDPNATGVLPICVGKGTKISSYLMDYKKTYIAEITFGLETDTEDIWGDIINIDNNLVDIKLFKNNLKKYKNITIKQIPPMYSAIKIKGKKLYELARKGINIQRDERLVSIYDIEVLREYNNKIIIKIDCSKGTYIRTLVKDLCREANTIGTMSALLRTSSGGMDIKESLSLSQVEYLINKNNFDFLVPIELALNNFKKIYIDANYFHKVINGVVIKTNEKPSKDLLKIYCEDTFIGIGSIITDKGQNYLKLKNNFYRGKDESN